MPQITKFASKEGRREFWRRYRSEYFRLARLGAPVMLTQVGVILVSFADTMMVGAYGVDELAASAFVNSVFLVPMVMLMGLANGITPLVGALFGSGDRKGPGRVARAGLQVNLIAGAIFSLILASLYFFLDRFGQPAELLPLIREFYLILLLTVIPMAVFNTFQQTANGMTDTLSPMYMILLSVGVNIFGNWLLIFGNWGFPELGLNGAGIATVIARLAGMTGMLIIFFRRKRFSESRQGFAAARDLGATRRKVWATSYPVMIQSGVECCLWSLGAVACGWFGKIRLAAFQIVNTVGQLGFMIYMSFGVAVSIRVANFCGTRDGEGASIAARAGVHLNLILATISSAVLIAGGAGLLGLFTPDAAVVAAGMGFMLPLVIYQYFDALQLTFCNAIRGTSRVRPLLWISTVSYVAVGIPVMLLFSKGLGWEGVGVYYSFDVALLVAAVMAYVVFRRTKV